MSGSLFYVTSFFFFISAVASCLSWIRLWEEKNYNLGRMLAYLWETKRGRGLLIGVESIAKWGIIFLYGVTLYANNFDLTYHTIVTIFYAVLFVGVLKRIFDRDIVFPSLTPLTISIFALTFLFELILFLFAPLDRFLWFPVLEKMLPFIVAIFVVLLSVFFDFSTDVVINQAIEK